jgi:hypothetical protein
MPSTTAPSTPYDAIYDWGCDNIREGEGEMPSPETLNEVARAVNAIQEFMLQPIAQALDRLVEGVGDDDTGFVADEGERAVSFADLGRLVQWVNDLRMGIEFLKDPVVRIALLANEDLAQIASGFTSGGVLNDDDWRAKMTRFHGLDRGLDNA